MLVQNRDVNNNVVVRYKTMLVSEGFTHRPNIDYDETYSPVMSGINVSIYLISLETSLNLKM
jgi:hypothetical protein